MPVIYTLHEFVRESNRIEGIYHDPNQDELDAHVKLVYMQSMSVAALEIFVSAVQPGAVLRRRLGLDVRVGNHVAPPGSPVVEKLLVSLLKSAVVCDGHQPFEVHQRYEFLHPFTDGNGRSGRALWLWMMNQRGEIEHALGIGFLHNWYYQSLAANRQE